jgi:hypothetical protein
MKKFTAKFESKIIGDVPDTFQDVVDLMENQKEYGNGCVNLTIVKGYCTKHDLNRYGKAQSISVKNFNKMKEIFPNGKINDKWFLCVKAIFKYEPIRGSINIPKLPNPYQNQMWTLNELEVLSKRVNSFKTIIKRLEKYCSHVVITPINNGFEGTETGESICILAILKQ